MNFSEVFRGRRVLVTGHTGFKGSWLCFALRQFGAEVIGLADALPTEPALFEVLDLASVVSDVRGDIRAYTFVASVLTKHKPEFVFHLAAQSLVRPSYDFAKETFDINAGGTVNVLEAARYCPSVKAIVVVTSDKCYADKSTPQVFTESDALGGRDPYSASKACAEIIFHSYAQSFLTSGGVASASARAGNVLGGGDWAKDRLVPDCVKNWAQKKPVIIRHPQISRPWQSVFDVIEGYLLLAAQLAIGNQAVRGGSFNFGPSTEKSYSVADIVSGLSSFFENAEWQIEDNLTRKVEGISFNLDSSKAQRELHWRPRSPLALTLKLTAEWYKNFYEGRSDMKEFSQVQLKDHFNLASS